MDENIERICEMEYGVGIAIAPVEAVLWSAEMISDKEKAKSELSRANEIRTIYGMPPAYAPYGHHAF
jgi:hypothetical protein